LHKCKALSAVEKEKLRQSRYQEANTIVLFWVNSKICRKTDFINLLTYVLCVLSRMFGTDARLLTVACRGMVMPGATTWLVAPYQILVLNSGIWWRLLLDIRCLWRHNMTTYSRLHTNVLAKFVDTTCIFRDTGALVGKQSRRHGGTSVGLATTSKFPSSPKLNREAL